MSILSYFRKLFRKKTAMETVVEEHSPDVRETLKKPVMGHAKGQRGKGTGEGSGTVVRKRPSELTGLEIAKQEAWEIKQARIWQKGEVILDTYRVEDVKAGGMGYVYIAEHLGWKVKMAIKSPNEMMLSDRALFARLLREADAWTELGLHPHIAYCYYVRRIEQIPHIFIEYVDGGNLREWIEDLRCYDLKVGLGLAIQFCHGIEYAHSFGMIHRDIKPENILITREGILKVTDFGIARSQGAGLRNNEVEGGSQIEGGLTQIGTVMGTPYYMAPEQWADTHQVDKRADIYSFGVCMFEMFCGRRPYESTSLEAWEKDETPYEPARLRKEIPAQLADLLKRSVALEREGRYSSFNELRKELIGIYRNLFQEEPPHAEVEILELKADGLNNRGVSYLDLGREEEAIQCWQETLKEDSQHLEATFNYGYWRWQNAEIFSDDYVTLMRELESSKKTAPDYWRCLGWIHFERGDIEAIEEIQGAKYRIEDIEFKRALEDPDRPVGKLLRTYTLVEGESFGVFTTCFSPNGLYALAGSAFGLIILLEISSGNILRIFEGHTNCINSICFSPDGRCVLSGSGDNTIRLWEVESEREQRRFKGHTNSVCFSPDGRCVLFGSGDNTIKL